MISKKSLEFEANRARLRQSRGKEYWRSLNELAETDEFAEWMVNEFPRQAAALPDSVTRRQFLKLMSASLALAGLTGCGGVSPRDEERIVPYVEAPENIIPGKPLYFATAMELGGIATGLLVESHMGRPTKVEGNPDHPGSLGATDVYAQASLLTLYDPDRAEVVTNQGRIRSWSDFLGALDEALAPVRSNGGAGLHILVETVGSPTLAVQLQSLREELPQATWYQYDALGRRNARAGAELAFGENVHTVYQLAEANVILSLDADFLACYPGATRYARDFSDRRRVRDTSDEMNRLYVVESGYSPTGSKADHRLPLRSSDIEAFARALAAELGVAGVTAGELPANISPAWLSALAADLQANEGASLVIAGDGQPPVVHALAHAINDALGNVGSTLYYTDPLGGSAEAEGATIDELADALNNGAVDVLVMIGGNPIYSAPADLDLAQAVSRAGFSVSLSLYQDESSTASTWHVPQTHFLEGWSDGRAYDGTATIMQPLIAPLYQGRSAHELLAILAGRSNVDPYEIVRATWEEQLGAAGFESAWRAALHDGVFAGTAFEPRAVALQGGWDPGPSPALAADALEITFREDPTIYDGRFANNAWLQELPKPITSLTWDNAAMISPNTADRFGLQTGELVELAYNGRNVFAPILIVPGHADNSVTATLGYGRSRAGQVGEDLGFNANALRTSSEAWFGGGLQLRKAGQIYPLAVTQGHFRLNGRDLIHATTLAEFREGPTEADEEHGGDEHPSLYPEFEYDSYAWGMVIDLTACVNCNACVVACQAENNIPVVGKNEVLRGREMHWLNIDTYYTGDVDNPEAVHMPRPCMHCEKAPCEPVCPVAATVHDSEGLNEMIYNRCVGTRYCSNNCPYKVRRFNFLEYTSDTPVFDLLRNPDVTVRSRGVMEKCTYCVQRISVARIEANKEGRRIRDGEVVTACAAVCPTRAIVFGDINDPEAEVTRLKQSPLDYSLLAELGTQPRTTYLAGIRNPNPELDEQRA